MMQTRRVYLGLFFALCLLGLAGCGAGGGTIKGTLVLPPNVKLEESDNVQVAFNPESGKDSPPPAIFTLSTMSFESKRVLPGTYKVSVMLQPYQGSPDAAKRKPLLDSLNDKYGPGNTKLTYQATNEGQQSVTIDLVKGTVTKQ